jgi:adenylate kinase family enzyme
MRIVLLGIAGAGKSTLARRLAAETGAKLICLDELSSTGGVTPERLPAFRQRMTELHAGEAWISDGNFAVATFDVRLPRADLIVWLEPPRWRCAWRALLRPLRGGEQHQLGELPRVLRFIWNFDRVNRPRIEALRAQHGPNVPVVRLRTMAEIAAFRAPAA